MRRIVVATLVVSVMTVGAGLPVSVLAQPATGAFVRVATWEDTATTIPPASWVAPAGIDQTPSGNVFTTDVRLRRVEVLDAAGQPITSFGRGSAATDLVSPGHVAVDEANDRVYVADAGARRVSVYTTAGAPVALWTGVGTPSGVAVAPDGRVVVTDRQEHRVHVLARDGSVVTSWGGEGDGHTEYTYPAGVHVADDGTVWVADQGNQRVVATTLDGQAELDFDIDDRRIDGAEPLDVAVDREDIWVATDAGLVRYQVDRGRESVRGIHGEQSVAAVTARVATGVYVATTPDEDLPGVWLYRNSQSSGEPLARWSSPLTVPGFFDRLAALAIGDDDRAYLLDIPPRIQRFALDGRVVGQIDAPDPIETDADATGKVYAAAGDMLHAFEADGTPRWEVRLKVTGTNREDIAPVGVAWDESTKKVWVLEAAGPRMFGFDESGNLTNDRTPRAGDYTHVSWADMAIGPDGTRYGLDAAERQLRGWDPYDKVVVEVDLAEYASRFDVAPDNTFILLSPDGWVRQVARDGTVRAAWDATRLDLGRGSRPVDVAVDATGKVYVADQLANVVTVYGWDAGASPQVPPSVEKGCELDPQKTARPSEIPLGETVEVSLVVRGTCAPSETSADIALLVDTSMERSMLKAARRGVEAFIDQIDPGSDQVVVQPENNGRLSNDPQYLLRTVRRIEETDGYSLGSAIGAAENELFGRRGRRGVKKVIVILMGSSRGEDVPYWEWWGIQRASGQAKRRGAEIFAIAFGRNADKQLLYDVATSRNHVYESKGTWQLAEIYAQIAGEVTHSTLLASLVISDEIPDNMELVEGSAAPPASLSGRTLVWRLGEVPLAGIGVRYRLRPTEPGEWPTNVTAWGDYTDADGVSGRLDFPVPVVRVIAPPTPTSTPPPTATEEPTPTTRPSVQPTPQVSPSPYPPSQGTVFLPLVLGLGDW